MKKRKKKVEVHTIIGDDVIIDGDISVDKQTMINGYVYGNIKADDDITINGNVHGNINGCNIKLNGNVKGNITSAGLLQLLCNSNVEGDIKTSVLVVDEGAKICGVVNTTDKSSVVNNEEENNYDE